MSFGLESCPDLVVECIVNLLDLDDICNLRLSCKSLAVKSSHYRFKTFFRSKHVDVTADALRTFAQGTQAGGLRSLVQELYLIGIANETRNQKKPRTRNDSRNEEIRRAREINLLSQAFNGLAKYSKNGSLPSLTLRVAIVRNDKERILPVDARPWPPMRKSVWQCTIYTFDTALRALAASKLRIESLNVFNDPDMERCSLACEQLNIIDWNDSGLAESFASLRSLSISISTRVFRFHKDIQEDEHDEGQPPRKDAAEVQAEAGDESNFVGLSRLLPLCNRLENFEVHYLQVPTGYSNLIDRFCCEKILQRVVELDRLPILKRCRLRGISAREVDLLDFVKRTRVCELSLESMILRTGTFRPIIDHCTSETANMTKLYFDTLYERHNREEMIFFVGGGKSRIGFPSANATERLEREGDSVRHPITYYNPPLTPMGNPWIPEWRRFQRTEHGV
ncbi:F-box domain protein [Ilyonectria robusta]|uniref:F-box domain protein n=1 Tax=Ilyonectria robusta TaxID=1079257 RepID=UPI001E8DB525|nr:F-box domain protein [Ilyonectria robusta]KAH8662730.1 F-box domain protein [Ilyonectria robusta]